jgi:ubiquinone/menaquinone biosynthesis C-methylase UbiE
MSVQKAYDQWSATYDKVENKTRDLEKRACESVLSTIEFGDVIEFGGGTGKNTGWLASRANRVLSVDLSEEMQAIAKQKIASSNVEFQISDISRKWDLALPNADLITCSLILEHVEHLGNVFAEAKRHLRPGGRFYVCELHPFKQYAGSKARFETAEGTHVLDCYVHNITDYTDAATANRFAIERIDEWFDGDDRTQIPRLLSFLFRASDVSVGST